MTNNRLFRCSLCPGETIQIGCFACDFNLCQTCIQVQRSRQVIFQDNSTASGSTAAGSVMSPPANSGSSNGRRQQRHFIPPKMSSVEHEPSAPSYELVVNGNNEDNDDDDHANLPSYEEALANEDTAKNKPINECDE